MGGDGGRLEPDRPWREIITGGEERLRPTPPLREAWQELARRPAQFVKRLTGADLDTARRWWVAGTDLGIPYLLENGSVGFLFGDTFASAWPEQQDNWRSPVMLRSNVHPSAPGGIVFDSAARVQGDGLAPPLMDYFHWPQLGGGDPVREVSRIPNDAVSFPETGRQVMSYMSVYFGEPSVRRLRDGVWAMRYSLPGGIIVSRRAERPEGLWSEPKLQVTEAQEPSLYGGFIHPYSTSNTGDLKLMVSTWQQDPPGTSHAYHVSHYAGTL